jgi:hypothetical protein
MLSRSRHLSPELRASSHGLEYLRHRAHPKRRIQNGRQAPFTMVAFPSRCEVKRCDSS